MRVLLIKSYLIKISKRLDVNFLSSLRCQIVNETASKRKSVGLKFSLMAMVKFLPQYKLETGQTFLFCF